MRKRVLTREPDKPLDLREELTAAFDRIRHPVANDLLFRRGAGRRRNPPALARAARRGGRRSARQGHPGHALSPVLHAPEPPIRRRRDFRPRPPTPTSRDGSPRRTEAKSVGTRVGSSISSLPTGKRSSARAIASGSRFRALSSSTGRQASRRRSARASTSASRSKLSKRSRATISHSARRLTNWPTA